MPHTFVKVVGFSDTERHSLNTMFRLSERHNPCYSLWTSDAPSPPQVALIDLDSYESVLEMASPSFNPNLKLICVGSNPPAHAWCTLQRPVDWIALIQVLDKLFAPPPDLDIDIGFGTAGDKPVPPGVKISLMVGMTRDQRLYLRSRLAIAGITDVDEAASAAEATDKMMQRHYELVIVGLELSDAEPWSLVQAFKELPVPARSIIVATSTPTLALMERSEQVGCTGMLEIPFDPHQVLSLLHMV